MTADTENDDFDLSPRWKQVAADLFGKKYTFGDVVPHDELREALGLPKPTGRQEADVFERWQLALVAQIDGLKTHLLETMNMDLQSVPGRGYEIVKPAMQTSLAVRDGMRSVRSTLQKMGRRLSFLDRAALTSEQARENADALARLSFLSQQTNKARRLKFTAD